MDILSTVILYPLTSLLTEPICVLLCLKRKYSEAEYNTDIILAFEGWASLFKIPSKKKRQFGNESSEFHVRLTTNFFHAQKLMGLQKKSDIRVAGERAHLAIEKRKSLNQMFVPKRYIQQQRKCLIVVATMNPSQTRVHTRRTNLPQEIVVA
jgi:hypothetical protein